MTTQNNPVKPPSPQALNAASAVLRDYVIFKPVDEPRVTVTARVIDYYTAYVPGEFRCPKCMFVVMNVQLSFAQGIGVRVGSLDAYERCPNDGTPLEPVRWDHALSEARSALEASRLRDMFSAAEKARLTEDNRRLREENARLEKVAADGSAATAAGLHGAPDAVHQEGEWEVCSRCRSVYVQRSPLREGEPRLCDGCKARAKAGGGFAPAHLTADEFQSLFNWYRQQPRGEARLEAVVEKIMKKLRDGRLTATPAEPLDSQIDRLAKFIIAEVPGEPSQSEGAVDTAIRIMRTLRHDVKAERRRCSRIASQFTAKHDQLNDAARMAAHAAAQQIALEILTEEDAR